MKLNEARDLAIQLMTNHGIVEQGWRFEFDNAKRRFGCCKYGSRRITLSLYLTELNNIDEVKNTILHEIAHALCPRQGHNSVWKRKAIEIGCSGDRCYSSDKVETVKGNYIHSKLECIVDAREFKDKMRVSKPHKNGSTHYVIPKTLKNVHFFDKQLVNQEIITTKCLTQMDYKS
jgi:hypothetical protein